MASSPLPSGDVIHGDKHVTQSAGGDIVGGDKLTHTGTGHLFAGSGPILVVQPRESPATARDQANLLALLHKVKTFWIHGVLERSVHSALLLELGREFRTDAVDHPWVSVLELPDATQRRLPPDMEDVRVFDEAGRALLILGEPGSGKTITLLEIARDLILRAEADSAGLEPIPVVFNLSTWHAQRQPLAVWLVGELASKYQVPARVGRAWLAEQRLLLLLDGLDEVDPAWQAACVQAINAFTAAGGVPGLVVCCRVQEYTQLPVKLRLNAAICLTPLTPTQVNAYLEAGGASLAALRAVIQGDDVLAVLAQTPLFLSIMCLAYRDLPAEALTQPALLSLEQRRQHLLERYVDRMFQRKGRGPDRPSQAVLLPWLGWLARQMSAHNLSVYLVERMQPSWLKHWAGRWAYALVSRAAAWWLFAFFQMLSVVTIFVAFAVATNDLASVTNNASFAPLNLLRDYTLPYVIVGLGAGALCALRFEFSRRRPAARGRSFWRAAVNVGVSSVAPIALVMAPLLSRWSLSGGGSLLTVALSVGTVSAGYAVLTALALRTWETGVHPSSDIPSVDALGWSWRQGAKGAAVGFVGGGLLFFACSLTTMLGPTANAQWLTNAAVISFPAGLVAAAVIGLAAGLRARAVGRLPRAAGWAARLTRGALTAGFVVGGTIGLIGIVGVSLINFLAYLEGNSTWRASALALGFGLACAFTFGSVAFLYYGGFSLVQQCVLRAVLFVERRLPWRLSRLADQAEDLVLLRRVGGGYIFIHRLVLEYFARLPEG